MSVAKRRQMIEQERTTLSINNRGIGLAQPPNWPGRRDHLNEVFLVMLTSWPSGKSCRRTPRRTQARFPRHRIKRFWKARVVPFRFLLFDDRIFEMRLAKGMNTIYKNRESTEDCIS